MYVNSGPTNHFPDLHLRWDQQEVQITPMQEAQRLKEGSPRIEVTPREDFLHITVVMMKPEQVYLVARRVREILEEQTA